MKEENNEVKNYVVFCDVTRKSLSLLSSEEVEQISDVFVNFDIPFKVGQVLYSVDENGKQKGNLKGVENVFYRLSKIFG